MNDMDVSDTLAPRSDQQNYDDYIAGPKTVSVVEVKKVQGDQPLELHLTEYPGRPFKPSKSMRRVLAAGWGKDASKWAGKALTLYGDPSVRWAGQPVGGIRISHMSGLDGPLEVPLTISRGKREKFTVQPLQQTQQQRPSIDELIEQTDGDLDKLRRLYTRSQQQGYGPGELAKITALAESIQATAQEQPELGEQE